MDQELDLDQAQDLEKDQDLDQAQDKDLDQDLDRCQDPDLVQNISQDVVLDIYLAQDTDVLVFVLWIIFIIRTAMVTKATKPTRMTTTIPCFCSKSKTNVYT